MVASVCEGHPVEAFMFKHRCGQWRPYPTMLQCVNSTGTFLVYVDYMHAYLNVAFHNCIHFHSSWSVATVLEGCQQNVFVPLGWNASWNNHAVPCGRHIENPKNTWGCASDMSIGPDAQFFQLFWLGCHRCAAARYIMYISPSDQVAIETFSEVRIFMFEHRDFDNYLCLRLNKMLQNHGFQWIDTWEDQVVFGPMIPMDSHGISSPKTHGIKPVFPAMHWRCGKPQVAHSFHQFWNWAPSSLVFCTLWSGTVCSLKIGRNPKRKR